MKITVAKWGNSLAVRIPAEIARELKLDEGSKVECIVSSQGALELTPAPRRSGSKWLKSHFAAVNEKLAGVKMTTPASTLLDEEERY
jgi:antitoxin component of MazEF toxin-antitoxin module